LIILLRSNENLSLHFISSLESLNYAIALRITLLNNEREKEKKRERERVREREREKEREGRQKLWKRKAVHRKWF